MRWGFEYLTEMLFGRPADPPKWSTCEQQGHDYRHRMCDWWWVPRRCSTCEQREP